MTKYFISVLIVFLFISCNNQKIERLPDPLVLEDGLLYSDSLSAKPFTGRHKSRMLDMKIEYEVVDGIKEGDFITYFPNDKVQISGKMKNNKNVGEWKYYFPTGSIETTGSFDNDIPTGKWTWYNQSGKIIEEGNLLNGLRVGEWKNYDSTGKLDIIRVYKADKIIDSTRIN
ncbi:MAG: toxin-antitoxin system YwqK family antitoxin [Ignavibacteriales bacterium]|nr:toxin-antitoxin system YwqK family antitoxin [Ignavibacteriales bacterium]